LKSLFSNPLFLLLTTGLGLGLYFPLGKQAGDAGLHPLAWSLMISLIPGLVLLIAALRFEKPVWTRDLILFGLIAGLCAYVIPNGLTFAAIPHAGSGYVALMFAVSPVFTALLSMAVKVRPPNRALLTGVAFGFFGAVLIAVSRFQIGLDGNIWPLLALLIPVSLAVGNVYRTARWPAGCSPLQVGAVANLGAVPLYLVLLAAFPGFSVVGELLQHPILAVSQIAVALATFLVFFRLQWVGGPTYLSQIGYVAAAVGLGLGSVVFGEAYPWPVWAGAGLIAFGVLASNWPIKQST
jgi:drug/metabolite transporter (DMT)-like permease